MELIPVSGAYVTEVAADAVKRNSHWEINIGIFFDTLSSAKDSTFSGVVESVLKLDDGKSIKNFTRFLVSMERRLSSIYLTLHVPLVSELSKNIVKNKTKLIREINFRNQ